MGIKHFWPWLKQSYGGHIRTISRAASKSVDLEVDILAIDMNGIIHNSCQKIFKYGNYAPKTKRLLVKKKTSKYVLNRRVFEEVVKQVEYYRKMVQPKKKILLCVDGVAGLSKMSQQRQRRFRSAKESDGLADFDSNCITPGTEFLDNLTKYLDWYVRVQVSMNPDWQGLEVMLSNEKVPGEGEHKIVRYLRKYHVAGQSCCIHGMDADLIMLALASPCRKMYIYREDSFRPDQIHLVDIGGIRKEMRTRLDVQPENNRIITDFLLMCYTVGNDFLPQVPGIEILQGGIDSLLHVYQDIVEDSGYLATMSKGCLRLNKKNFLQYLVSLSDLEEELINGKVAKSGAFFPDEILSSSCIHNDEGKLVVDIEEYKRKYYAKKFPSDKTVEEICKEYIKGMQWVLNYYTTGIPSWVWNYPFDYAPFISDLVKYLPEYKWKPFPPSRPVLPLQQLMAVLPEKSSKFLPPPIARLMSSDSVLGDFFPEDFFVDVSGKRKEWEGITILPKVDIEKFTEEYQKVSGNIDRRSTRRNIVGKSFSYTFSTSQDVFHSHYGDITNNMCERSAIQL